MMNFLKNFKDKQIISVVIMGLILGIVCSVLGKYYPVVKNSKPEMIQKMYAQYKQKLFPQIADISVEQLNRFSNQQLLFVDIRDKQEQDISMIPGAVTQQEFELDLEKYKNRIIIAYCTIGNRSGRYLNKFKQLDIEAYNLIGGILSWSWSQRDLVNADGLTKQVHVYGSEWNLLPDNFKAVF